MLYLDADFPVTSTKSIYFDLIEAGLQTLRPGSLVLAHNTINAPDQMPDFLAYVRDPGSFRQSMTMIVEH